MQIITKVSLKEIKAAVHTINILMLMLMLPHSWTTVTIALVYTGIMFYVYTFLKTEKETPAMATIGLILVLFLLTGYIEGL